MTDLTKTIEPKSDQLNADDLLTGPRTVTITDVRGSDGDQPVSVHFEGDNGKPYKPCKSMRRVMVRVWGTDGKAFAGKSMTLYCDPKVKWGGIEVGGIRISHVSGIERPVEMMLTASKAKRHPYTVEPLVVVVPLRESPGAIEAAMEIAKGAAAGGTEAFKTWWNSEEGKGMRAMVKPGMKLLQATAIEADEIKDKLETPPEKPDEEDPNNLF